MSRPRRRLLELAAGAVLAAVVFTIYEPALRSYHFEDGLQWLSDSFRFRPADLFDLDRYAHFYRPVIHLYFYAGLHTVGCEPAPFQAASVLIHLLNTLLVGLIGHALTRRRDMAWIAAVLFAVQPAFVEAVAWVGAITDLMPAFWYLLTIWLHLRYLHTASRALYAASLIAFAICLGTHESAATLLVVMMLTEAVWLQIDHRFGAAAVRRALPRYLPFALLLTGFLLIAYLVNSRSYLVSDGHYRFGWHAVPHMLQYVAWLIVWKSHPAVYAAIAVVAVLLFVHGTPARRYFLLWLFATMGPASFFTWANSSRYVYLPAAGFSWLIADLLVQAHDWLAARRTPAFARGAIAVLTLALAVRYAHFAHDGANDFFERTRPFARLAAAARTVPVGADNLVVLTADQVDGIQPQFVEPAVQVGLCRGDVKTVVR
jgi:hypothetical protein